MVMDYLLDLDGARRLVATLGNLETFRLRGWQSLTGRGVDYSKGDYAQLVAHSASLWSRGVLMRWAEIRMVARYWSALSGAVQIPRPNR